MPHLQVLALTNELRGLAGTADYALNRTGSLLGAMGLSGGEVLLLGHDPILQGTRLSLLEKYGFSCQSATDAACLSLDHHAVRLLILCHTLTLAEACHAVEQVLLRSPSATILRLVREARVDEEACFRHVLVAPKPDRLIATVQHLSNAPRSCC